MNIHDIDLSAIRFADAEKKQIPGNAPGVCYNRIKLGIEDESAMNQDLMIMTPPDLFSFGAQEKKGMQGDDPTKKPQYQLPLSWWGKGDPPEENLAWFNKFEEIVEMCKLHLIQVKKSVGKGMLEMSDLRAINPLKYKMNQNEGCIDTTYGPTMYAKLNVDSTNTEDDVISRFATRFHLIMPDGSTIENQNPVKYLNQWCNVTAVIHLESIYIGNSIKIQVRVFECDVKLRSLETRRSFLHPQRQSTISSRKTEPVASSTTAPTTPDNGDGDGDDDDEGIDLADATQPKRAYGDLSVEDAVTPSIGTIRPTPKRSRKTT